MIDLSKFTTNKKKFKKKNIEWNRRLSLKSSLLPNFVQSLIMLGLKKFRVVKKNF